MPKRNGAGIELLADPTRRRIIAALAISARRPSSLATELGLSRPATSRQLRLLVEAGLIARHHSRFDGRVALYAIADGSRGPILAWLAGTNVGRPIRLTLRGDGSLIDG